MFSIEVKEVILSRCRYHVFVVTLSLHDMWIETSRLEMLNCCNEELWSTLFLPIAGVCCQTDALLIELATNIRCAIKLRMTSGQTSSKFSTPRTNEPITTTNGTT